MRGGGYLEKKRNSFCNSVVMYKKAPGDDIIMKVTKKPRFREPGRGRLNAKMWGESVKRSPHGVNAERAGWRHPPSSASSDYGRAGGGDPPSLSFGGQEGECPGVMAVATAMAQTSRLRSLGGAGEERRAGAEECWRAGVLAPPFRRKKVERECGKLSSNCVFCADGNQDLRMDAWICSPHILVMTREDVEDLNPTFWMLSRRSFSELHAHIPFQREIGVGAFKQI